MNANPYKGLSEEVAKEHAQEDGYAVRITSRDGHHFIVTRDYREDRVNFDVVDGLVISAHMG